MSTKEAVLIAAANLYVEYARLMEYRPADFKRNLEENMKEIAKAVANVYEEIELKKKPAGAL